MKFLKYALLAIALLVVAFFLLGVFAKPVNYQNEVLINKPVSQTWAVMGDESQLSKWLAGYKRTEKVSGTPRTVGAVSKIYFDEGGSEMVIQETITALEANKKMATVYESDFMDMKYEMLTDEVEGKTKIVSRTTATGKGIVSKAMMVFLKGTLVGQEDTNLGALKTLVESQ